MTNHLGMEIRSVEVPERIVVGMVAPYDETSYLAGDPGGERILRGAFNRSITHRGSAIPLHDNHSTGRRLGTSSSWEESDVGLVGVFSINEGPRGDDILTELRQGYFGGMSVGFQPIDVDRSDDGVRQIREAELIEVSLVGMPAYEGAGLVTVRSADVIVEMLRPFQNPPAVDLSPIPQPWRS